MIVHYQNSLLRPQVSILRQLQARPVLDRSKRPVVVSGAHSLVAKVQRNDGTQLALRLLRDHPDTRQLTATYEGIRRLALTTLKGRLPVGSEVRVDGIEVDGATYPVLVQEWVQGPTLAEAVTRARQSGNSGVLRALASAVVDLANDFRSASFAHRNLQPDNLLISVNGSLVAVGLDHAMWPGGVATASDRGAPSFLHPQDQGGGFTRDAFAVLLIVASLHAMADDPALAATFGDPQGTPGGSMLFSTWDFADPRRSRAFGEISANVSSGTRELVDALRQACLSPLDEIERWLAVVPGVSRLRVGDDALPAMLAQRSVGEDWSEDTSWPDSGWDVGQAVRRVRERFEEPDNTPAPGSDQDGWGSWGRSNPVVESMVPEWTNRPVADFSGPVDIAPEPERPAPRRRQRPSSEMRSRPLEAVRTTPIATEPVLEPITPDTLLRDRAVLRDALNRRQLDEVERSWQHLVHDPLARTWSLEVEELRSRRVQELIRQESQRRDDGAVVRLADGAATNDAVLDVETRKIVRSARERVRVKQRLRRALDSDARNHLADLAVSGDLTTLGDTDRQSLRKVLRALDWPMLERALATDDDQIILAAYDPAIFEEGLDSQSRERVDTARRRVAWRTDVRHALKARNVEALEDLFTNPPPAAIDRLSTSERRRARQLIEQQRALSALREAIKRRDDGRIVAALNHIERVGARIADRATWGAIQNVVERETLADDILTAANSVPFDVGRIAQLLPAARALGMSQDPRLVGEMSLDALEHKVLRQAHLRRIRAALGKDNDASIVTAAIPDPYGVLDELSEGERDRIAAAIVARRSVDRASVAQRFE